VRKDEVKTVEEALVKTIRTQRTTNEKVSVK